MAFEKVRPQVDFPELEEEILGLWKENGAFQKSVERATGRQPVRLLRGAADGQRQAGLPSRPAQRLSRTCSRATRPCAATASSARPAGTPTASPSRSRSRKSWASTGKAEIERTASRSSTGCCRERVFRYVEDWQRDDRAHRLLGGHGAPLRTLDNSYIESVWWALKQLCEKDLLSRTTGRLPTARATRPPSRPPKWPWATSSTPTPCRRPERLRQDSAGGRRRTPTCSPGPPRPGPSSPTPPSPSIPKWTTRSPRSTEGRGALILARRLAGEGAGREGLQRRSRPSRARELEGLERTAAVFD